MTNSLSPTEAKWSTIDKDHDGTGYKNVNFQMVDRRRYYPSVTNALPGSSVHSGSQTGYVLQKIALSHDTNFERGLIK